MSQEAADSVRLNAILVAVVAVGLVSGCGSRGYEADVIGYTVTPERDGITLYVAGWRDDTFDVEIVDADMADGLVIEAWVIPPDALSPGANFCHAVTIPYVGDNVDRPVVINGSVALLIQQPCGMPSESQPSP